jgi:hypothetical protein
MATAGTASNSVFPRHSPLTSRTCSLPGAQPIAPAHGAPRVLPSAAARVCGSA